MKKECKLCNKLFTTKYSHQKFCDKKCRNKFWALDYYYKNKEKILKKMKSKEYRAKERKYKKLPKNKQHRNEYLRQKRKTDPCWKLKCCVIDRIRKDNNIGHLFKMKNLELNIGYKIDDLWLYLKSNIQPTFSEKDYLCGNLEIDHIIDYHWFLSLKPGDEEFKKCWDMRNLRLITKKENLKKYRKKMNWEEIKKLDIIDLLPRGADEIYKTLATSEK